VSDQDQADKEAKEMLPCPTLCGLSYMNGVWQGHEGECPARLRPRVAAKLRERDKEIALYKKLWAEAAAVYALSVKTENKLRAEIDRLKVELTATAQIYKDPADAWHAVVKALNKASPGFLSEPYNGVQCAVKTIERMQEEIGRLRNKIAQVIQLGLDFGFPAEPEFSVGQVITHAKYLQQERARFMFEVSQLHIEIDRLKAENAEAKQDADDNYVQGQKWGLEKARDTARTRELSENYSVLERSAAQYMINVVIAGLDYQKMMLEKGK